MPIVSQHIQALCTNAHWRAVSFQNKKEKTKQKTSRYLLSKKMQKENLHKWNNYIGRVGSCEISSPNRWCSLFFLLLSRSSFSNRRNAQESRHCHYSHTQLECKKERNGLFVLCWTYPLTLDLVSLTHVNSSLHYSSTDLKCALHATGRRRLTPRNTDHLRAQM